MLVGTGVFFDRVPPSTHERKWGRLEGSGTAHPQSVSPRTRTTMLKFSCVCAYPKLNSHPSLNTSVSLATVICTASQSGDGQSHHHHTAGPHVDVRPSSSLPLRPMNKKNTPKKSRRKASRRSRANPLSPEDLSDHVSNLYIHGPGGVLPHKFDTLTASAGMRDDGTSHSQDNTHLTCSQAAVQRLDRHPALVLNADYQPLTYLPLSLWSWQDAVKAIFSGKVTVVDVYPDVTIRAASLELPLPSVIALNEYVPTYQSRPAFTKRNVFLRDEYRCQYCADQFHTRDLSLDHVVPRCRGGRLTWDNAVTSCRHCNGRKGSLDVTQLGRVGMRLQRSPHVPTPYQLAAIAARMLPRKVHPTWEPYLQAGTKSKSAAREASVDASRKTNESADSVDCVSTGATTRSARAVP
jgi:5-methylcytosine-specific restriction endonuclease McrA